MFWCSRPCCRVRDCNSTKSSVPKKLLPVQVILTTHIGAGVKLRAEHQYQWELDKAERQMIHQWDTLLESQGDPRRPTQRVPVNSRGRQSHCRPTDNGEMTLKTGDQASICEPSIPSNSAVACSGSSAPQMALLTATLHAPAARTDARFVASIPPMA